MIPNPIDERSPRPSVELRLLRVDDWRRKVDGSSVTASSGSSNTCGGSSGRKPELEAMLLVLVRFLNS